MRLFPLSSRAPQSPPLVTATVPSVDRRSHALGGRPGRIQAQLRLRLRLPQSNHPDVASGHIQELLAGDLSMGGIFIQCQEPPQVGEQATVEVCRPGGGLAFAAGGRVVWRRPALDRLGRPAGFGLSFERLDVRDASAIRGIIGLLQRQQALRNLDTAPVRELVLCSLNEVAGNVSQLLGTELPPEIAAFMDDHRQVGERDAFLWRWAYQGVSIPTLSCVDPRLADEVSTIKLLAVMYAVLLDDAADRAPRTPGAPAELFCALCQLWTSGEAPLVSPGDQPFLSFARRVRNELMSRVTQLGRYQEFADLLRFDMHGLVQAAYYQLLLHRCPPFVSEGEGRALTPMGIPLCLAATIDLCASPAFDARETGLLREVLAHAQRMAHTGYILTNWQQQCERGDLSSPAVAYGLASGALSPVDIDPVTGPLRANRLLGRLREARVDSHFLSDWLRDRFTLRELARRLRTVDVERILSAQQRLMWLQLSGLGLV
ncbi:MAG: PilZ domain-containing protein [Myxococcales bacterium]|nr:PilZ domain-containing protein [Myxococcota bacterium]MDW8283513.1 PilZ domain-containing protein [Myxococcales bacterium]